VLSATIHGRSRSLRAPAALCVAAALVLATREAGAAPLGSLVSSVGLFAALAALAVAEGWSAHVSDTALLPTAAGGALAVVGGAAWWWRGHAIGGGTIAGGIGAIALRALRRAPAGAPAARFVALPPGIDRSVLMRDLRDRFVQVQEAWDLGAMPVLRQLTTPGMLEELCACLPAHADANAPGRTEVLALEAELFAFEQIGEAFVATVEFSGRLREPSRGAAAFKEVWMLTRARHEPSGWRLARHQALF
jgi:Tim44-like domain